MARNNLILIGMPGSGKSTAGVILAKLLGMDFIDSDILIQKESKMTLPELIAQEGPDGFLEVENWFNTHIDVQRTVIATGGSVVYGADAMKHFKETGVICYLQVDYEEISMRLMDIEGRGVVLRDGQTLKDLYDERIPLYEKYADFTVSEEKCDVERVVAKVSEAYKEYKESHRKNNR